MGSPENATQVDQEIYCLNCGDALSGFRLRYCSDLAVFVCGDVAKGRRAYARKRHATKELQCRCGKLFVRPTSNHSRFCSVECRPSWKPPRPRPVRLLCAQSKPTRICVCGESFVVGFRGLRFACSSRCEVERERLDRLKRREDPKWRTHDRAMRAKRQQKGRRGDWLPCASLVGLRSY